VVSGPAGVGKTTLAVTWAHQVADRFPDGQLYVNLDGFGPAGTARDPGDAVRGFLDALGVQAEHIPPGLAEQSALFRSVLAERRVLVVLDNAASADQVRPLLPGSPTCFTVVTSRNPLSGLVAAAGARPVVLDVLDPVEARELMAARLGTDWVDREPGAVDEIITACARLPRALAVAAASAATRPTVPLADLAHQLGRAGDALDAFSGEDAATDVRTVFSWSYHLLSPAAGRLFRLLGLQPGAELGEYAAASLAGVGIREIRALLAELVGTQLVTARSGSRYECHDLLRAYAADLAATVDPPADRDAALRRLSGHYVHTARGGALARDPGRNAPPAPLLVPGAVPEEMDDADAAQRWFTREYQTLVRMIGRAERAGLDRDVSCLAWALLTFVDRRGHWQDQLVAQRAALRAAERLRDDAGRANAHRGLGRAYCRIPDLAAAESELRSAMALYTGVGDASGEANVRLDLGWVASRQGNYRRAIEHARRALHHFREAGPVSTEARAWNNAGWSHALLGEYDAALACCREALALHRRTADRPGQAAAWDTLDTSTTTGATTSRRSSTSSGPAGCGCRWATGTTTPAPCATWARRTRQRAAPPPPTRCGQRPCSSCASWTTRTPRRSSAGWRR
jgi:hypothetical protein